MTSSAPSVLAVIPARYGSSRFPGKPLAMLGHTPMVVRVWQQVCNARHVQQCVVATDDERIAKVAQQAGASVCMTRPDHPSGTDRMWEVALNYPDYDILVNVQGDEPFIDPNTIDKAIGALIDNPELDIATLVTPIATTSDERWTNPNVVKAVLAHWHPKAPDSQAFKALYFSRSAIPFHRNPQLTTVTPQPAGFQHLGLYAYRRLALQAFVNWPPSPLEQTECLEQLRALEHGLTLGAVVVNHALPGIDTPEDLAAAEAHLAQMNIPAEL